MLGLPPSVKILVARDPVDMRKGFNGLSGVVRNVIESDPLSGHLYVFFNRRRTLCKILWWEPSGYVVLYKRLERGTFTLPHARDADASTSLRVRSSELLMIFDGLDLRGAERKRRYDLVKDDNP